AVWDGGAPCYPFKPEHLAPLAQLRPRQILAFCHHHRERCIQGGRWVPPGPEPPPPPPPPPSVEFEQAWNDFQAAFKNSVPDEEAALAELLAWAVTNSSPEVPAEQWFSADPDGRMVPVERHGPANAVDCFLVGVCEKDARGGRLGRQITEVEQRAGQLPAVLVRSTAFPARPGTAIANQVAAVLERGGRRVVVENT